MIVECPACHARFSVADHLIPTEGRTVRCSKCAHAWHVQKVVEQALQPVKEEIKHDIFEPTPSAEVNVDAMPSDDFFAQAEAQMAAPRRRFNAGQATGAAKKKKKPLNVKPFKIAAPLIALTWVALALVTYFPSWSQKPGLSGIYHAMGAVPTEGLAFADVQMEREQEGSKTRFILSGSIRNNSNEMRAVPVVRVLLKDKANKTIWGREYPVKTELKAGEVYPFRISNVETTFAKNVASIVVDMGNSLQLMVR